MNTRRQFLTSSAALAAAPALVNMTAGNAGAAESTGNAPGKWLKDRTGAMSRNVELVSYIDLGKEHAGYQMAMQEVNGRRYLYCVHWWVNGISVFDVTDPAKARFIRFVPEPSGKKGFAMFKLRLADGIGITHMQPRVMDFFFGPQPEGTEYEEGALIWDFSDPENPEVISRWHSGVDLGTHRNFYNGGRYVHLAAAHPDYIGTIYRILDIQDPANPVVVGQWAHPETPKAGSGVIPAPGSVFLHGLCVHGGIAYLAYDAVGMVLLDISNVTNPKFLGQLRTYPPFGGGAGGATVHTCVRYADKPIALVTTEGERPYILDENGTQHPNGLKGKVHPMNIIGIADVSDLANPVLISICPKPSPPPGSIWGSSYSTLNGVNYPFGPHNVHEPSDLPILDQRSDRIYSTYFQGGMRVFDISDPYEPMEIAAYCPPDPKEWNWQRYGGGFPGRLTACTLDILVDNRGYIYMTNDQAGLHILRVKE